MHVGLEPNGAAQEKLDAEGGEALSKSDRGNEKRKPYRGGDDSEAQPSYTRAMRNYFGFSFGFQLSALFLLAIFAHQPIFADQKTIEGTVKISPKLAAKATGGSLFVFARPLGQPAGPPAAVLKVDSPKFPQAFSLGEAQAMIPGTEFKGPYRLTARFSPTGDAMQKTGAFEGQTDEKKGLSPGAKGIEILIDKER
jgi:cytochrome c-type biogenesis protein CcmH